LYLSERNIYGSSRLGMENVNYLIASSNATNIEAYAHENVVVGDKAFELSNHLGNFNDTWVLSNKTLSGINPVRNLSEATGVLNTITDKKLPEFDATTGDLAFFNAVVVGYSDYYPFGMQMPGRHGSDNADSYRYGFQGQEKDDEVKGAGNSVNYKYRMHDPRIGRFFAVDPLASKYSYNSPYAFSENKVIAWVELEGLESVKFDSKGNAVVTSKISIVTEGDVAVQIADKLVSIFVLVTEIYNSNNGIEYFHFSGQNYERQEMGVSIVSTQNPDVVTEVTFSLSTVFGGDLRSSFKEVYPTDENGREKDAGVVIVMGTPDEFANKGDENNLTPAFYRSNKITLNPAFFSVTGEYYNQLTDRQIAEVLAHEIGHDFGLQHLGEDHKPSNSPEAYPNVGLMAPVSKVTEPTSNELHQITNNLPEE
jgi:RHS repeat-associated protein